jgi:hypothetical protein
MQQLMKLTARLEVLHSEIKQTRKEKKELLKYAQGDDKILLSYFMGKAQTIFEPWDWQERNKLEDCFKRNNVDYCLIPIVTSDGTAYEFDIQNTPWNPQQQIINAN